MAHAKLHLIGKVCLDVEERIAKRVYEILDYIKYKRNVTQVKIKTVTCIFCYSSILHYIYYIIYSAITV